MPDAPQFSLRVTSATAESANEAQATGGSFRIFRLWDIDVYVHWTWFIAVAWMIYSRFFGGTTLVMSIALCFTIFVIVLLHEFGHALACRSVGGRAERVLLLPLGGAALVLPPPRAGAWLWSISAGPLVNFVVLLFTLPGAVAFHLSQDQSPFAEFVKVLTLVNGSLLVLNLLPLYPLDGGQMLRAVLWWFLGEARSLYVAAWIGLIGTITISAIVVLYFRIWDIFLLLTIGYMVMSCIATFRKAKSIAESQRVSRRYEFVCPACGGSPLYGQVWTCEVCHGKLDAFVDRLACPHCGNPSNVTPCIDCGRAIPAEAWIYRRFFPPAV